MLCSRAPGPAPSRGFTQSHRNPVTQASLCPCGTDGWGWDASTGVWPQTHSMVFHLSPTCSPWAVRSSGIWRLSRETGSLCACGLAGLRDGLTVLGVFSQPHTAAASFCPGPTLTATWGPFPPLLPTPGTLGPNPSGHACRLTFQLPRDLSQLVHLDGLHFRAHPLPVHSTYCCPAPAHSSLPPCKVAREGPGPGPSCVSPAPRTGLGTSRHSVLEAY